MARAGLAVVHGENAIDMLERAGHAGAAVVLEHGDIDQLDVGRKGRAGPAPPVQVDAVAAGSGEAGIGDGRERG
jgi:hypothetical protein